jgi:hypothetical protein
MKVRYKHECCPDCQTYEQQAKDTIENLGFTYLHIGNNWGHGIWVEVEEGQDDN